MHVQFYKDEYARFQKLGPETHIRDDAQRVQQTSSEMGRL